MFKDYDICITGAALKQYDALPSVTDLIKHTFVYARVSPAQKEFIITTLRSLGYITLMAGDGTNDVGALKAAHIGVALLDGSPEDLKKIAEHQKLERMKKVYEQQVRISARFNQPPPPPPPALREAYPELVKTQQEVAKAHEGAKKTNPLEKFDMTTITSKLSELDEDQDVPQIKLGDASCAAPFTSKLSNVSASKFFIFFYMRLCLLTMVQFPTLSVKVDALWSPPSKCTRFSLSTVLSPPIRCLFSTLTASSLVITR